MAKPRFICHLFLLIGASSTLADDCLDSCSKGDSKWTEVAAGDDGFKLTQDLHDAFERDGFFIVRGLLDSEEVDLLRTAAEEDVYKRHLLVQGDDENRKIKLALWKVLGDDVISCIARSEKIVNTFEKLLGGEVFLWQLKIIMKDAFSGGAHTWHQDYGYWYEDGCLMPNLGTVSIAIDKADKSNGCLKVIPGSHKAGRLRHTHVGDQAKADMVRVNHLLERNGLLHMEMEPGDAVFFHSNLVHRADQNHSPTRRWAYLVAYNRRDNEPILDTWHTKYVPLKKMKNSDIKSCPTRTDSLERKNFMTIEEERFAQNNPIEME